MLFNGVIDYVTSDLPSSISIHNDSIVKYMAFADDLILFAKDEISLQAQVDHVIYRLKECGLDINPAKSATLNIIINPKKKQWICNPYSFIIIDNIPLKPLTIDDTYKYLGIEIGHIDNNNTIVIELTSKLISISKALLKPQQKLDILKSYLLPSVLHRLTFSNIYLNTLKTMDRSIRSFVRRWLRLPKYTSLGVFYAPCSIGGLAITRLFLTIPVMRLKRVNSTRGNDDLIIQTLPNNIILKWSSPRYYDNILFTTNIDIKVYHTKYLINSADGRGLDYGNHAPFINNWIKFPTRLLNGKDFVDSIKLKHALLYTKFISKRMFPNTNNKCLMRGCNYNYDCLNHIMQTCSYNYNNRIHRHNYINSLLMSILNKHKYITILEPHIQTRNGLRKPDLIIYKNDTAYIIDTQISIDTKNTDINNTKKTNYYNTTDNIAYTKQITGANRILFSASYWNWRRYSFGANHIIPTKPRS